MTRDLDPPPETAPPFEARLEADGLNVVIAVPIGVSDWFAVSGPIPVQGHVDDVAIEATLMPVGGGQHQLFLNREMRDAAGLQVGDIAHLRLWRDPSPRETVIPEDLAVALGAEGLLEDFEAWPPSHQREYILAIEDARQPETRERRIQKTLNEVRSRR